MTLGLHRPVPTSLAAASVFSSKFNASRRDASTQTRDPRSDTAELLRFRAKWVCAIMSDPRPTWDRATRIPAGPQAARVAEESDDPDVEMGETLPNAARKRARKQPSDPRRATKTKKKLPQDRRKRTRFPSQDDKKEVGGRKRRVAYEAPQDAGTCTCAPHGAAGIHPQDTSVGEDVPPRNITAGYHTGPARAQATPARKAP